MLLKALVRGEQGTPKSRVMSVTQEGVQAAVLTHHNQRASLQFSHTQGAGHPLCMIRGCQDPDPSTEREVVSLRCPRTCEGFGQSLPNVQTAKSCLPRTAQELGTKMPARA